MLSEKGFSLIEVLISLTILSISVLAAYNFFYQAKDISVSNNSKLVSTNLARMTLDRVQKNYKDYGFTLPAQRPFKYGFNECLQTGKARSTCEVLFKAKINGKAYDIIFTEQTTPPVKNPTIKNEETALQLFPIVITVNYGQKSRTLSTNVEGYIKYGN